MITYEKETEAWKVKHFGTNTQQGSGRSGILNQISLLVFGAGTAIPSHGVPPGLGMAVKAVCDLASAGLPSSSPSHCPLQQN